MTPERFREIRESRGKTRVEFARELGYSGKASTLQRLMRRIEGGEKEITPETALKAIQLSHWSK